MLSAIQTISFVLIGNLILEIKGMTLSYCLVLFTTSCFANILGLNISSAFNSVITIYLVILFIIIPQLLFSGVLVKFDKLNLNNYSSREYVPLIGDLMVARWSFEALAVKQFKDNKYKRNFIEVEIEANPGDYYSSFLIDALKVDLYKCLMYKDSVDYRNIVEENFRKLNYYINRLSVLADTTPGQWKGAVNIESFDSPVEKESIKYLENLKKKFRQSSLKILQQKEAVTDSLIKKIGKEEFLKLRENCENGQLNFLVLGEDNKKSTIETNDKIIQKYKPGYMKATSKFGRAHFYAPVKRLGNLEIDTYWFNILAIWIVSIVLYLVLYFNLLTKAFKYFENLRFKNSEPGN